MERPPNTSVPGHVWYRVYRWLEAAEAETGFWVFRTSDRLYVLRVTTREAVHFEVSEADTYFEGSPVFLLG